MKYLFSKILFLLGIMFLISCEEKELVVLNPEANTNITFSSNDIVLLEENELNDVLTITWTKPDFGFNGAPTYSVLIDLANEDFSNPKVISVGNALTKTFTVGELNSILLALNASAGTVTEVAIKIETKLSNYEKLLSEENFLNITAYSTILDLSTEWGIVGSATPGGWGSTPSTPIKDIPFWTTPTNGVHVAYCTLRDGFIKFRTNNAWTTNYGDDGNNGSMESGGADIPVTAGTYRITMNLNDLTYTIESFTWGIVGSATPNQWDGPDLMLYYNSYANDWRTVVSLNAGEIKFRLNNLWDVNYGGTDGVLVSSGDNIQVTKGNYLVKFDPVLMTYSLESLSEVWGLVGSATPNSWDGPDQKFIPDFGINEGTYYINGATLTTGFIKIRQNDAWAVNYGDTGNDGTLEAGGADIPVNAGTYNIQVNFSASPPTIGIYPFQ